MPQLSGLWKSKVAHYLIFLSWELIRANIAEAKFIELTVSQLMQFVNHVVVPALKSTIDSGRLYYHQLKRSFQEDPIVPVRERHKTVEPRGCTRGNAVEAHCNRSSRQVVGT